MTRDLVISTPRYEQKLHLTARGHETIGDIAGVAAEFWGYPKERFTLQGENLVPLDERLLIRDAQIKDRDELELVITAGAV